MELLEEKSRECNRLNQVDDSKRLKLKKSIGIIGIKTFARFGFLVQNLKSKTSELFAKFIL